MYQFLFLREWRPNLSVISAAFIALGKSYKQRKKRISQSARYTCDSRKRKAQQVWHLQYGLLKVASDQYFGGFNTKSTNPIKMKYFLWEKLLTFLDKFVDNRTRVSKSDRLFSLFSADFYDFLGHILWLCEYLFFSGPICWYLLTFLRNLLAYCTFFFLLLGQIWFAFGLKINLTNLLIICVNYC